MRSMKRLAAAALALALCLCPAAALEPAEGEVYEGADVSVYQGQIDFAALAESGVRVVYIRAGAGAGYTDPRFAENAAGARGAGLDFGFYHYVTARDADEAREQARFFAALIEGRGATCRPAMDLEDFSGLSRAAINAIGLAFLEELEALTGVRPMLYTDAYAADALWDEALGAYPLWAAEWGPEEPEITSGIWRGWTGFQYTDEGRLPGIRGRVDRDRFTAGVLLGEDEGGGTPCRERRYTVRPGDTLWGIARRFGTTVEALARLNGIRDPDLIYAGQVLRLPDICA